MRTALLAAAVTLAAALPAAAQESDVPDAGQETPAYDTAAGATEAIRAQAEERALAEEAMTGIGIPDINVALVEGDLAVAADTTDRDGLALFPAEADGEYGLILQEEIPTDARVLIEVDDGRAMLLDVPATTPIDTMIITFPAGPEAMVFLRLEAADASYTPPEPEVEPVEQRPEAPIEQTHDADEGDAPALLTADEDE